MFPRAANTPLRLADLLIRAGAIYSMAQDRKVYRAIAIRDEWIVAVSEDPHGLDSVISAGTHVVDAPQLTILPAFEDTHNHFILAAQNSCLVPVDRAHTLAECIDLIRQRAAQTPPGEWIRTSDAWHEVNLAEKRLPTAPELDEATREHPVVVRRGGHVAVANSLALKLGGITRDTPDPQGGTIVRFPDSTPTGVLIEAPAHAPITRLVPALTFEQMVEGLRQACQEYNSYGLGTVRDPMVTRDQVPIYQTLWERGELTIRSRLMLSPTTGRGTMADKMEGIEGFGVRGGFGDDLLKLWGLKFGLDGGAEGGALDQPYVNNPGYRGHLLWSPDDLHTLTNFAVRRGWRIGTHAIGDRAVRTLLDVYEQVIKENPGLKPGTLVIEHGFLADAEQRARDIRLGVSVTVQHPLLYTLGSVLVEGWGKERTREIMPVRAWLEEGASHSARLLGLVGRQGESPHGHDRGSEACHGGFPVSLLPEVPLLFHRQAARREEFSHMLSHRRRTFDAKPQWLANGIEHGSYVAYGGPPSCFDEVGIEVVECDDTATGGARDLTQSAFDGLPVQVHRHTIPKEECRFVRIEACIHKLLEPVLRHEISRHERDPSRVQAGLFQHLAFCLLSLRDIDLETVDSFRHPV